MANALLLSKAAIKYHVGMTTQIELSAEVPESLAGSRLDQIAAQLFPDKTERRQTRLVPKSVPHFLSMVGGEGSSAHHAPLRLSVLDA